MCRQGSSWLVAAPVALAWGAQCCSRWGWRANVACSWLGLQDVSGVITPSKMWHFYEEQMKR
jgi:hypothetical protein